jgi:hypothetical protein
MRLLASRSTPNLRAKVRLLVWPVTLDLSGKGDPTSSNVNRWHSSQGPVGTQAPPPRQSGSTIGATWKMAHYKTNWEMFTATRTWNLTLCVPDHSLSAPVERVQLHQDLRRMRDFLSTPLPFPLVVLVLTDEGFPWRHSAFRLRVEP